MLRQYDPELPMLVARAREKANVALGESSVYYSERSPFGV